MPVVIVIAAWRESLKKENNYSYLSNSYLLLPEQEACMGESWPRSRVQTEHSEATTHDRGQESPIQTDLAQLIRCLLDGKEEKFNSFNVTGHGLLTFCLKTEIRLT